MEDLFERCTADIISISKSSCWNKLFRKLNDRRGDNRSDDSARKAIEIVGKTALFEIDGGWNCSHG